MRKIGDDSLFFESLLRVASFSLYEVFYCIEGSIRTNEDYYRKESLIHCINTGQGTSLKTDLSFKEISTELTEFFNNQ